MFYYLKILCKRIKPISISNLNIIASLEMKIKHEKQYINYTHAHSNRLSKYLYTKQVTKYY